MHKYIEVVKYATNETVKRIDVSEKSGRSIDKIENGLNINLNHEEFFTQVKEYENSQDEGK